MLEGVISIIIPTFNRGGLIKNTLHSIARQTYTEWECIVIDDGSNDNTKEIVGEFIKKDLRYKYLVNNRKKGAQGARNVGILNSKGEYISFFDSDNLMLPERLSKQIKYLKENPICDVCTCYSHLLNDNNEITGAFIWITEGNILKGILEGSTYVDYNNALIRESVLDKIGLLDEDCPSFQEWDTHIRLADVAKYGTVHELLVLYYQRSNGRISTDTKRELYGLTYIYAKHKKLWIAVAGKIIYFSKIYSLALRISREDKVFKKEMIIRLPELKKLPFKFKIKILLKKLWHLIK